MELDEPVHCFGAAVARAVGVEVAQERGAPLLEGPAEAGDLGDRAGRQASQDLLGEASAGGVAVLVEAGSYLLGAAVGDLDLEVSWRAVKAVRSRSFCRSVRCSSPARRMFLIR